MSAAGPTLTGLSRNLKPSPLGEGRSPPGERRIRSVLFSGAHGVAEGEEMKTRICMMTGLLIALAAPMLQAADEAEPPKVRKQGATTYVSGGSGEAQRKALFKIANKFPIQLIFEVEGEAADISGVKVTLTDLSGNALIEAVSEGPYFYMNPPAGGRFTIDAEYNGEKQTRTKDLVGRRYLVLEFKFHPK